MKSYLKNLLRRLGFAVQQTQTGWLLRTRKTGLDGPGVDVFVDMHRLTSSTHPVIFDVGANVGQTTQHFKQYFKTSDIHAFEPSSENFAGLVKNTQSLAGVHCVNSGLGARQETRQFSQNALPEMSSFLELGKTGWGDITQRSMLQIETIDAYCRRMNIDHIDILKSDTQGFDFEVLLGATQMFKEKRIRLVYIELIFSEMYENLPRFEEIYSFLSMHGMNLVSFYDMNYSDGRLSWTNALFQIAS